MVKPKFSSRLTKPITPGLIGLDQYGSFDEWFKSDKSRQEFFNRMYKLLEHYQIDASSKDGWFILACKTLKIE